MTMGTLDIKKVTLESMSIMIIMCTLRKHMIKVTLKIMLMIIMITVKKLNTIEDNISTTMRKQSTCMKSPAPRQTWPPSQPHLEGFIARSGWPPWAPSW